MPRVWEVPRSAPELLPLPKDWALYLPRSGIQQALDKCLWKELMFPILG